MEGFFFKKFRQNRGFVFFAIFFKNFSNFSKTTLYFSFIVFGPLRRDFKTSFKKFKEKKIGFFSNQKISNNFFFFAKKLIFTSISQVSRNLLNIFKLLFFILLEKFLRHLLKNYEKKNPNILFSKNFEQLFFFGEKIHFYKNFSNISKTTQYFQINVFRPIRRVFKTSF